MVGSILIGVGAGYLLFNHSKWSNPESQSVTAGLAVMAVMIGLALWVAGY